jgi:hypothetical protein
MNDELSTQIQAYLRTCGTSSKSIATYTRETRLWHDLGIYGDVAEANLECLNECFGVDLSEFDFERYFPFEFIGKTLLSSVLIRFVPFLGDYLRRHGNYTPLTLGMIDDAINSKKLI